MHMHWNCVYSFNEPFFQIAEENALKEELKRIEDLKKQVCTGFLDFVYKHVYAFMCICLDVFTYIIKYK